MNIRSLYTHRILLALLVAAALAVALMTILVIRQQHSQTDGQIFLEAGGSAGAHPFLSLAVPPATTGGNQGSGATSFQTTASTDNRAACDPDKLVSYLASNPQASQAWVHALNSDRALSWSGGSRVEIQQIPSYLHELTPRLLADDLRVTNYQFTNGAGLAVQSVLQKGTAVLVDAKGIARVRCACGNPLTPMVELKVPPIYRGTPWPAFRPRRILVTQRELPRPYQPVPPAVGAQLDPQPWQGEPARLALPPYPDKPDRSHGSPHPGRPGPDGLSQHHPDGPAQPVEPHYPDRSAGPAALKHPDKPASPHKKQPVEDRAVESNAGPDAAQPGAQPEQSAVQSPRIHQRSNPSPGRPVHAAQQDRADQPASPGPGKPARSEQTTAKSQRSHDLGSSDRDQKARATEDH